MKIRLIEPGWETLTGQFGIYDFENGVSIDDIPAAEAAHLANLVRIETVVEDGEGKNPSSTQTLLDTQGVSAKVKEVVTAQDALDSEKASQAELGAKAPKLYTVEDLRAVADAEGIAGVRAIAEPMGLKANSITALIQKVLEFQRDYPPKA